MKNKDISLSVINHGCKLNQFEGEALENSFKKAGFRVIHRKDPDGADITIINTCTVTNKSDRKSRNSINRAIRNRRGNGLVVITGCYAETNGEDFEKMDGVDLVVGNTGKAALPSIINYYLEGRDFNKTAKDLSFKYDSPLKPCRSRVFVKVQDGCDMGCSYCKVPYARGKSRSRNPEEIVAYVKEVVSNGYKEIVLTGVNLGDYTYKDFDLSRLITLLADCKGSFRIRLSSIEPFRIKGNLYNIICNERVVPHFHLPLQSGSDRILRLMNRPYSAKAYMEMADRIRSLRPECHLATDIIVGFPTESEKDFIKTLEIMRSAGFASAHIFKYSLRAGTKAAGFKDDVPYHEKTIRSSEAQALRDDLGYRYRKRYLGKAREAVFEKHNGSWTGITDNYIKVNILTQEGSPPPVGDLSKNILPVKITEVCREKSSGVINRTTVD